MVSKNCESWEEEMYWKNFHFARFSLNLPHDFHHRLMLPKKFTDHMRTQLPDKVNLKVNGLTWKVDLERGKNDAMLQGNGWHEFAKAYSLKKSDMLFFQYDKHECFEVLLFDQANQCEKEASYFVRKEQHVEPESLDGDDSGGEEFTGRNQGSSRRRNSTAAVKGCFSDGNVRDEGDEISDGEDSISAEDYTTPKKASTDRVRAVFSNFSIKSNYKVAEEITPKRKRAKVSFYKSNRRPVTDEEKNIVLEKARKTSNYYPNSFFVIMRPTSVYKRFFMSIPKNFRSNFHKGQELVLRIREKTWVCTFQLSGHTGGLEGSGWRSFALENHLEEFDVCLFFPCGSMDGKSVLNVSIFRVVPQVVKPSPVTPDDVEANEISSEDCSQRGDDSDSAQRKRHRKNSGRNAHNREDLRDEDESDKEKFITEKKYTPENAATLSGREVPSNFSRKRMNSNAGKPTPKENGTNHKSSARSTIITEVDKEQMLERAQETAANYQNSFISVMKPTSVNKCYFMSITKEWKFRHTLRNGQEVILRLKREREKAWVCTFCSTPSNVGLQTGWKDFVLDNKLRESDVCLFVPAQENNGKCILDVLIFRVSPPEFLKRRHEVLW